MLVVPPRQDAAPRSDHRGGIQQTGTSLRTVVPVGGGLARVKPSFRERRQLVSVPAAGLRAGAKTVLIRSHHLTRNLLFGMRMRLLPPDYCAPGILPDAWLPRPAEGGAEGDDPPPQEE